MQTVANFTAVLNTQAQALEKMMTNQVTSNPHKMSEAMNLLEQAVCTAIAAAKETNDEVSR